MLKIGDIEMKNQVVLAPMADVCNPAFRLIAMEEKNRDRLVEILEEYVISLDGVELTTQT